MVIIVAAVQLMVVVVAVAVGCVVMCVAVCVAGLLFVPEVVGRWCW